MAASNNIFCIVNKQPEGYTRGEENAEQEDVEEAVGAREREPVREVGDRARHEAEKAAASIPRVDEDRGHESHCRQCVSCGKAGDFNGTRADSA